MAGVGNARAAWVQALGKAPTAAAAESLLRLEMAAEVPTPAEQLDARRALQLKLLTRRNDRGAGPDLGPGRGPGAGLGL